MSRCKPGQQDGGVGMYVESKERGKFFPAHQESGVETRRGGLRNGILGC